MQTYDLIMLAIITATTMLGAWQGMAWQIASITSVVFSYVVACALREPVATLLPEGVPYKLPLAMLILYVGTSLLVWVTFQVVARFLDRMKLKEFDRQIGAVMGLGKGVLLCVVVTLFCVGLMEDSGHETVVHSYSGYCIAVLMNEAEPLIPGEVHERLGPVLKRLECDHACEAPPLQDDSGQPPPHEDFAQPSPANPWPAGAPQYPDPAVPASGPPPTDDDHWSAQDRRYDDGYRR
jgi:membrane protein required for colicin V production